MTGIEDVARAAGVSAATVSRALRGLPNVSPGTRARIEEHAAALGYVASAAASGLATGRTSVLGVVVPAIQGWFTTRVLEGIESELRAIDYDLMLFPLGTRRGERERAFHRSLLRRHGDALLALCIDFTSAERAELDAVGMPVAIVGGPVRGLRHVGIDEIGAALRATEHLIGLGHRDILHLTGGDEIRRRLNPRVPHDRRLGYEQALRMAGIAPDPARVVHGWFSAGHARRAIDALLESGDPIPTAIFAASDEMAMGAILSLQHHGLTVPGDVSVIGIDDHELADSFGLTTVAQDPSAQGAAAARMLLDELAGRPVAVESLELDAPLVVRSSTAAPRGQSRRVPSERTPPMPVRARPPRPRGS